MRRNPVLRRAFTLIELLVAIGITSILLVLLVGVIRTASDAWRLGRARLITNSEARTAMDIFCRDLQNAVLRSSPRNVAWLQVINTGSQGTGGVVGEGVDIRFLSVVPDREALFGGGFKDEDGDGLDDEPVVGDLCGVSYRMAYKNPLPGGGDMQTFGLYRRVVSPIDTFANIVGKPELSYTEWDGDPLEADFLAGNILDFAVSFVFERSDGTLVVLPPREDLVLRSNEIETSFSGLSGDLGIGARLVFIQVNVTVLDEEGAELARLGSMRGSKSIEEFVSKHGYEFSQQVQVYAGL